MTFEWNNAKDWAKVYKGTSIMYEGIASYPDEKIFLSKETLKKCMPELKGRPVIIEHQAGITPENMKEHEVGYVTNCYYNNETGDFDCDFVIDDDTAKDLLDNKGYTLSTSYIAKSFGNSGTFINSKYDREITDLDFRHLAIVKNPRYERVKVYQNEVEEIENGGPGSGDFDHAGRPGKVGGSEPAGTGRNGKYEGGKKQWTGAKPKQQKLDFNVKKEEKIKYFDEEKTGMQMYDDVLTDSYYAEKKQRFPKIIQMSPDEYIQAVNKGFNDVYNKYGNQDYVKTVEQLIKSRQDMSLQKLREKFGKVKFDMPMIAYVTREDGSIEMSSQEGLHRAILAKEFNVKKMPVAIFSTARYGETVSNNILRTNLDKIVKKIKSKEKQNDTEKEYNMDKIEVEQGFLNSLIGLVVKQFDNAKKEEKEEEKDLKEVLEDEEKIEDEKEKEKENKEEEKEEEKENKCKNNSVEVDYYELMKEKFNSVEAGTDDKIKVVTRETAFENGKKIYG